MDKLHISISAETLWKFAGLEISNSIFTSMIVSLLLILFAFSVRRSLQESDKTPCKLRNFVEFLIEAFYSLIYSVTHSHKRTRDFLPLVVSFFLFILINNWFGLLPGVGSIGLTEEAGKQHLSIGKFKLALFKPAFATTIEDSHSSGSEAPSPELGAAEHNSNQTDEHAQTAAEDSHELSAEAHSKEGAHHAKFIPLFRAGTADLNTTLALAIFSVFFCQVVGVKYLKLSYFKKFFNFSSPIMFFIGILELISEFAKIMSFAFRLFGNIFAGEVLLAVIAALLPVIAPMPFYGLEIFVGFIQALVFSMLTLVFLNMATLSHDDH
ncbi:MAG: F0F1 ATP synthase subunit A [Candidatus Woesebacteria bacterium]|jgi:F-type H+-transporting ATPase subunit a